MGDAQYVVPGCVPGLMADADRFFGEHWIRQHHSGERPGRSVSRQNHTLNIGGGNVNMSGTNGSPGAGYRILSSTNLVPLANPNWDASGQRFV